MSDSRQPTQLIANIADKMDEMILANSAYHNYDNAIRALNYAQRQLAQRIVRSDRGRFLASTTLSFVADQADYDLPGNFLMLKDVEITPSAAANTSVLWGDRRVPHLKFHDRNWADNYTNNAAALRGYVLYGQQIRVVPTPTSAKTDAWTIYYYQTPPDMSIGTAEAGDTDSITLALAPEHGITDTTDDYYNGAWIYIASGTGAGQSRRISDYDGDTREATVSSDWSTTPDTTSVYEILSSLEPIEMEALVYSALHRLMARDADGARDFQAIHAMAYAEIMQQFQYHATRRTMNSPYIRLTME